MPSQDLEELGTGAGGCRGIPEARIRPCPASPPYAFNHPASLICKAWPNTPLVPATVEVSHQHVTQKHGGGLACVNRGDTKLPRAWGGDGSQGFGPAGGGVVRARAFGKG